MGAEGASRDGATAALYVIRGSHACASAELALREKALPYRKVVLRSGVHPLLLRLRGFPGNPRSAGGRTALAGLMERLGTVPAVELGGERVQTNHALIRWLDRRTPSPPLLPADPVARERVEAAERWVNDELQMMTRRLLLAAGARGAAELAHGGADGRLGALLGPDPVQRRVASAVGAHLIFRASGANEDALRRELPPALDRADALLAAGVIGGERPNAADVMVAPCLALLDYRLDLRSELRARPCFAVVDRLLPDPCA